jgi:23S rRNA pseudouridine1911/1915/1917 synthase
VTAHVVPDELHLKPLDGVVRALFGATWGKARAWISSGKISLDGAPCTETERRVRKGTSIELRMAAPRRARGSEAELAESALVYVDPHVVIVNKPPGISTVPYEEGEKGTLDERVRMLLQQRTKPGARGTRPSLGVVHRLDKETSGLLVFTRTWLAKQSLAQQFRVHSVHRRYLAIVHGHARAQTITSHIMADRGDGLRGSMLGRGRQTGGQLAITHVEVIERLDGATLVACRLETGRTHQIRIHLSESGTPLVGERVYIRRFTGDPIPAPRMMLHAAELGFVHPATNAEMRWTLPLPADMEQTLARLRRTPPPRDDAATR